MVSAPRISYFDRIFLYRIKSGTTMAVSTTTASTRPSTMVSVCIQHLMGTLVRHKACPTDPEPVTRKSPRLEAWKLTDRGGSPHLVAASQRAQGKRERAMLAVFLGCGLGRREPIDLTVAPLQRRQGHCGPGGKRRAYPYRPDGGWREGKRRRLAKPGEDGARARSVAASP